MTFNIIPTVGRAIWYWPSFADVVLERCTQLEPCRARIIALHSDGTVSLEITENGGDIFYKSEVEISDAPKYEDGTASWCPFGE